jgi:RNA polymerase sigma-70 factor (ECF subfamily)
MDGTDVAVVARVKGGDHEAFRVLVERHSRSAFRVAFRLTGHEQDAEDVVQEAFLRAFRQIGQFEARASFATWLHRITFNCAYDLLRQRPAKWSRVSLDDEDPSRRMDIVDAAPGADPARTLDSRRLDARLRAAMASLTTQERAAFVLRHFEGLSIDEIGKALNLRTSAAKHSVFRAVRKLRESLGSGDLAGAPVADSVAGQLATAEDSPGWQRSE